VQIGDERTHPWNSGYFQAPDENSKIAPSTRAECGIKQTFYGFRLHARVCWPGVLRRLCLAPANRLDPDVAPSLTQHLQGVAVGDRLFWRPRWPAELRRSGLLLLAPVLLAPCLMAPREPWPARSRLLSRVR